MTTVADVAVGLRADERFGQVDEWAMGFGRRVQVWLAERWRYTVLATWPGEWELVVEAAGREAHSHCVAPPPRYAALASTWGVERRCSGAEALYFLCAVGDERRGTGRIVCRDQLDSGDGQEWAEEVGQALVAFRAREQR